ncbi:MAG: efflux RND transporter periplasmic adaptor subunit [Bryobacteraceae bacterium]|nr:efflux RND transporter periplasmic adaptor subunit [Bryobacteraceae bacterium]
MKRAVAAACLAAALAGCQKQEPRSAPAPAAPAEAPARRIVELDEASLAQAGVRIEPVEVRRVPVTVRANGRLAANEEHTWRVGAITDGRIIQVLVRVGDRVEKGQVLARMFSHDVHESRAMYRRAVAEFNRLQSNLEYARRQRDRIRRLLEMKAASQEQLDTAENELRNAETALRAAEIEVSRTRQHLVEFLEIPVEGPEHREPGEAALSDDDLIPIRAPAAGVVISRLVTAGSVVQPSGELFVISDLSSVWVIAAVQEEYLPRVHTGMAARVSVQAYPERPFYGRVLRVDEKLDPETRTVQAIIQIDNRGGLLKPEMYGVVELESGASEEGLYVLQSAIQDINGQPAVFVVVGRGRFEPRPVETGRSIDRLIEIRRGLRSGERVVAEGGFVLKSQLLKSTLSED